MGPGQWRKLSPAFPGGPDLLLHLPLQPLMGDGAAESRDHSDCPGSQQRWQSWGWTGTQSSASPRAADTLSLSQTRPIWPGLEEEGKC